MCHLFWFYAHGFPLQKNAITRWGVIYHPTLPIPPPFPPSSPSLLHVCVHTGENIVVSSGSTALPISSHLLVLYPTLLCKDTLCFHLTLLFLSSLPYLLFLLWFILRRSQYLVLYSGECVGWLMGMKNLKWFKMNWGCGLLAVIISWRLPGWTEQKTPFSLIYYVELALHLRVLMYAIFFFF
jgi:hypothetical protein